MLKNNLLIIFSGVIALGIVIILIAKYNQPQPLQPTTSQVSAPSFQLSDQPTLIQESSPSPSSADGIPPINPMAKPGTTNYSVTTGENRGQITANYLIPATPNSFGTAQIKSNWNNLVPGAGGKFKAEVCVSAGGQPSVAMGIDTRQNGTMANTANWIAMSSNYIFNLYDLHGGELPDCGGVILSTTNISVQNIPVIPTPRPR